jgi:hypothetical protein
VKANLTAIAVLFTLGCPPASPASDASFDIGVDSAPIDDVGTDASYDWPDAFAMDASVEDILCSGMPVPRDLPCEAQTPATASGCGGIGRVVYDASFSTCVPTTGADCGPVRGAFNTMEECAMACGRTGTPIFYPSEFFFRRGGKPGRREGPLDFSVPCESIMWNRGMNSWPFESSRCAHFGLLAPLHDASTTRTPVPPTMSNQEVWELLNAVELVNRGGVICVSSL